MQNKCNNGCNRPCDAGRGFIPVNGNWDFNCCEQYQQNHVRRGNRRNDCPCDERGKYDARSRSDDSCACEMRDDSRKVERCEQNTYIRQQGSDYKQGCDCKSGSDYQRSDCKQGSDYQQGSDCKQRSNYDMNDCRCREDNRSHARSACTGCDDCPCDSCARKRNRGSCDNAATYARSGKNRGVGMIKGFMQEIDEVFQSESALRAGTLFPELHKPMNGYCPCDGNCGTCKQAAAFAAWEMRLYLNTHPHDKEALALFRKLCREAEDENYATTFLKDDCCTADWNWVKNPWPWEYDCQCGD